MRRWAGSVGRSFTFDFGGPLAGGLELRWPTPPATTRPPPCPNRSSPKCRQADGSMTFHGHARRSAHCRSNGRTCPATGCASAGSSIAAASRAGPFDDARCALRPDGAAARAATATTGSRRRRAACSAVCYSPAASCAPPSGCSLGLPPQADRFALRRRRRSRSWPPASPVTAPAAPALDDLARQLDAGPYGHGLGRAARRRGRRGLEVDAERIRPLALARRWGVPERHAIEACLRGHPPRHARAALGPAVPALPRRQGHEPPRSTSCRPGRIAAPATSTMAATSRATSS